MSIVGLSHSLGLQVVTIYLFILHDIGILPNNKPVSSLLHDYVQVVFTRNLCSTVDFLWSVFPDL